MPEHQRSPSELTTFTGHDAALHGQLVDRAAERLTGGLLVRERDLEHHAARLHVGDPPLGRTLTGIHAGFRRLLGQRAVRVDGRPHLATTLDVTSHGDTSGLDLPVRHVAVLKRLDAVLAEADLRATLGGAVALRGVLLPVLDPARDEHVSALRLFCGLGGRGRLGRGGRGRPTGFGRGGGRARGAGTTRAGRTVAALATRRALGGVTGLAGLQATDELTLVDPHLDADAPERRLGLEEAVVDVGTQRVQRDAAIAVVLGAGHLGTAETTAALHADALDLRRAHGGLDRLPHRAAERHAVGKLLRDRLGDQLGVGLGVLDLEDVQLDLLLGQLLQRATDPVGLRAAAADDDARPGGVDVDADAVTSALDLDLGDAGALHARRQQLADLDVLGHVLGVLLVGVPARLPVRGDTQAETVRVDLLAHYRPPAFFLL